MGESHLVWDWNGTLLNDQPVVLEAVNRSIGEFGFGPINADDYRNHYTRPVRHFYDSLFGRVVTDAEWEVLNSMFHDVYFNLADDVDLTSGAREALDLLASSGWTQSLLSMSPQDWLEGIVARLGLFNHFEQVEGLSGATGGLKATYMEVHLRRLGLNGTSVVVVGDTPDDVAAARHVGASPILFDGGSHHIEVLEAEGVPIAETISEAARMARTVL